MDDEKIKELAQATGLSEEDAKKEVDKTEMALNMAVQFIYTAVEAEVKTQLTDAQKEHIEMAYKMSLMFALQGMGRKSK